MGMDSKQIRKKFLDYYEQKGHDIVASAPMVVKDDPTLMFTNAGMNQFKDYFLGHAKPLVPRVADTQKCLRVSGKHNDLEEVGRDSYHQTMFEMLGNWSFGDYFKKEAIDWAWDLLVNVYGLSADRMYATVFGGDEQDGLAIDSEAEEIWKDYLPVDRILRCDKKDNFWEMGDTGPCGPCSEIHYDLRPDEERFKVSGADLVNQDDPLVIEIWNLVFIQFNRLEDGSLSYLPSKHVDTGMGFERLTMALQGKTSNYDTDIFTRYIDKISQDTGIKYTGSYLEKDKSDIAMRVMSDHIRAAVFAIADGAIPSNTGAGYVIRRILRRAIRYYYSYLNMDTPYLHRLVPVVADYFSDIFPEVQQQESFIKTIILEEEKTFLNTLEQGLRRFEQAKPKDGHLEGSYVFELYDTYGFPLDLTQLIATEKGWTVDIEGFEQALEEQKERSRQDAKKTVGDWHEVQSGEVQFIGYDHLEVDQAQVIKYRTMTTKDGEAYQLVLNKTPFYAEGGGQVGDTGSIRVGEENIAILDTVRENDLIIHQVSKTPDDPGAAVSGQVDAKRRRRIECNHSATHLLHAALREVLGDHVQQKGSLVAPHYLRFDFSHFQRISDEDLYKIESLVNEKIRQNISLEETRRIPIEEAKQAGAMMLFGEKYGDEVRMITFDENYSRELCGGCHVPATGHIGTFLILSSSSIASGVRRIEALTGLEAEEHIREQRDLIQQIGQHVKHQDILKGILQMQDDNKQLLKQIDQMHAQMAGQAKDEIKSNVEDYGGYRMLCQLLDNMDSKQLKDVIFQLEKDLSPAVIALGSVHNEKPTLMVAITKELASERGWHAGQLVKEAAKAIRGGGGGQPFFASAGGSYPSGMEEALNIIKQNIQP